VRRRAELPVQHVHHRQRLRAGDAVMDGLAFAPRGHQAFFAQHAQLLRQRGLADTQADFELAHALFTLRQLAQQQQAVGVGQDLHQAADGVGGLAQRVELQVHVGGHGRFRAHDFDEYSLLTNILFVNRLMPSIRHHRGLAPWPLPS
jgi:hypothetical protein